MNIIRNMLKSGQRALPLCLFALLALFTSCKEEDSTQKEEFPDWQARNDAYFSQLVADVEAMPANDTWLLLPSLSKPVYDHAYKYSDYVVVERIEALSPAGSLETESPLSTDTVSIHYVGRLIPSDSYADGMEFDRSYDGAFNTATANPVAFCVGSTVDGFATALQSMHRGDHWRIYVPYQLAYSSSSTSSIPAYSTLIFDLRLVDFWKRE